MTSTPEPPWIWPRTAYIHIPFCAHKCGYCDFASLAGSDHLADRYLDALATEIATLQQPQPLDSLFIGGGTPTRLEPHQLDRLFDTLNHWLPLTPGGECTVEANPGTLTPAKVDSLARAGVNRVSLGAQSFHTPNLAVLERNHHPQDVARALDLVKPVFPRWSLDLIFGVPGSTLDLWQADLHQALAFAPDHLSCYALTYEKGTLLHKQRMQQLVHPLDEDLEAAMFELTITSLELAGLHQYEISSYARPGHESRHNLAYWTNDAYFGFGLGASRYLHGVRSSNTRDLPAYLKRVEAGLDPTGPTEQLTPEARARETAVLMLRRTQLGLDRPDFLTRTGHSIDHLAPDAIKNNCQKGWLTDNGRQLLLTPPGRSFADSVAADFL